MIFVLGNELIAKLIATILYPLTDSYVALTTNCLSKSNIILFPCLFDMEKVCITLVRGRCVRQFLGRLAFTEWAAPMPWSLGDYTQVCNGVLEREL